MRPPAPKRIPAWAWARLDAFLRPATSVDRLRSRIVSYWRWGIANEPAIHYRQERPMEDLRNPARLKGLPRWADCSEFVTDGYAWAGADDPNRCGYSGAGYTGTLLAYGRPIALSEALPGDVLVLGAGDGRHACGVLEADDVDPLLVSHGQERGPIAIRYSVERAYFAAEPAAFLCFLPTR